MAVHQKHPSIVALSTKKRVKQFKQLFNNNSKTDKSSKKPKHTSNNSILELKKRGLVNGGNKYQSQCNVISDNNNKPTTTTKPTTKSNKKKKSKKHKTKKHKTKNQKKKSSASSSSTTKKSSSSNLSHPTPPIAPIGPINAINGTNSLLSIMPQPIHCRALPTWLETSDDDEFTQYTDYTDDTDLDEQDCNNNDDDDEYLDKTLAICATLTLSTSIGDSPPPNSTTNNPLDSTIFVLQQSITSPANTAGTNTTTSSKDKFNFAQEDTKGNDTKSGNDTKGDNTKYEQQITCTSKKSQQVKQSEIIKNTQNITKQLKPCNNKENKKEITKQWEASISNSSNNKIKHGPTQSLLALRNRKLVNGGLMNGDDDNYNDEGREGGGGGLDVSGDCGDDEDNDKLDDTVTSDGDVQSIGRFTVISPSKKRNKYNNYKFIDSDNIITTSIQRQTSVKEWKPISNVTYKRTPRESLILLQKKKLVNGGLKSFDFIKQENDKQDSVLNDDNDDDDDSMDIFDQIDPSHRTLPTWLTGNDVDIEEIVVQRNRKKRCHIKQETDVLD